MIGRLLFLKQTEASSIRQYLQHLCSRGTEYELSLLSSGKLRASYTRVGNDANPYLLNTTFTLNPQFVSQSVQFPFKGVPV
jgi:hypothetical protein